MIESISNVMRGIVKMMRLFSLESILDIKQAYKRSPFFYWSIFLLLTNWIHYPPIDLFRTMLWTNQLWIPVFFVLFTINFFIFLKVKKIHESSKQYRGDKRPLAIISCTMALFLCVDLTPFLIGIIEIMSGQCPQIIVNPSKFQQGILEGTILEFIIPLAHHLFLLPAKKFLNKNFYRNIVICPKDELEISLPFIFMSFFISLIYFQIANYMTYGSKWFTGTIVITSISGLPLC